MSEGGREGGKLGKKVGREVRKINREPSEGGKNSTCTCVYMVYTFQVKVDRESSRQT